MGLNWEANLMISALEIREKKAIEIMIKFKDVYSLNYDEKLLMQLKTMLLTKEIEKYENHWDRLFE